MLEIMFSQQHYWLTVLQLLHSTVCVYEKEIEL